MGPAPLETFTDGVIAVVITIMVLSFIPLPAAACTISGR